MIKQDSSAVRALSSVCCLCALFKRRHKRGRAGAERVHERGELDRRPTRAGPQTQELSSCRRSDSNARLLQSVGARRKLIAAGNIAAKGGRGRAADEERDMRPMRGAIDSARSVLSKRRLVHLVHGPRPARPACSEPERRRSRSTCCGEARAMGRSWGACALVLAAHMLPDAARSRQQQGLGVVERE